MWKIKKLVDGQFVVLVLSGRIQGEELAELKKALGPEHEGHVVTLDLEAVRLVDQATVAFLAFREECGTRLLNCPAYIREWISRISSARVPLEDSDSPQVS